LLPAAEALREPTMATSGRSRTSRLPRTARSGGASSITYAELAKRLKKHGFKTETEAGITMKLQRKAFAAAWFPACLAALELDGVALEEI
jgi:hypothetical protein